MKNLLIFFALIIIFSSCGERTYFSNTVEFEDGKWTYEDLFENSFSIADTSASYHLILDMVHDRDYPFQNVYMNITTHFPVDTAVTDLLSIDMADRFGQWHGNCRGDICNLRVFLQQNISFKEPGDYTVVFEQYTRREELNGIYELNFRIIPN
ncbi:MAG: gliding motility lipoprotein GldH [Saprospirales bacterium]|nr:MAG: gliding motility lipoprotein GldH [Saprospirales bacterium]